MKNRPAETRQGGFLWGGVALEDGFLREELPVVHIPDVALHRCPLGADSYTHLTLPMQA